MYVKWFLLFFNLLRARSRLLHLGSLHSLAYALLETEEVDAALTLLDIIVDLNPSIFTSNLEPGYFDYYNQMGSNFYMRTEFTDAKKCFERLLEINSANERTGTMMVKIEKKLSQKRCQRHL